MHDDIPVCPPHPDERTFKVTLNVFEYTATIEVRARSQDEANRFAFDAYDEWVWPEDRQCEPLRFELSWVEHPCARARDPDPLRRLRRGESRRILPGAGRTLGGFRARTGRR